MLLDTGSSDLVRPVSTHSFACREPHIADHDMLPDPPLVSDAACAVVGGIVGLYGARLSGCAEVFAIAVTEPVQHAVWAAVPAGRSVWHYRHGNLRSRSVPNLLTGLRFVTRLLLSVSRCFFSWMGGDSGPPLLLDIAYRTLLLPRGRMNLPAVFSRE